jgi:Zn-dependent M28 family amino/carboxypeptidase
VVGILRGSDPKLRNEYVVYTAHLDHLGIGKPVNGDAIYHGAMDDAAGVAAVIEIARAFQSMKQKPRRSIIFIATTGEEKGLLGSDYYARHPTVPQSQIVADINIDSINLWYDSRDVVVIGSEHSSLGTVVDRVAAKMGLEISPDDHPEQRYLFRTDTYSFIQIGVPSIFPWPGYKTVDPKVDGANLLREWFQTRYHQPNDDMNQPMDFEAGAKNSRFDFLLGYTVAQDENRPVWKDGDFFGKTFGKGK